MFISGIQLLMQLMKNEMDAVSRRNIWIVDVRDVASAHVFVATMPEAAGMQYTYIHAYLHT